MRKARKKKAVSLDATVPGLERPETFAANLPDKSHVRLHDTDEPDDLFLFSLTDRIDHLYAGNPPRLLRECWNACPPLRPKPQTLAFLRAVHSNGTEAAREHVRAFIRNTHPRRAPYRFYSHDLGVFGGKNTNRCAREYLQRDRDVLLANLFLLLVAAGHDAAADFFAQFMTPRWRTGPVNILIKAHDTLSSSALPLLSQMREFLPTLCDRAGVTNADNDSTLGQFLLRYRLGQLASLYAPAETRQRIDSLHIPPLAESLSDPSRYMTQRRLLRTTHLLPYEECWRPWLTELLEYAAAPESHAARSFAAYCAQYYLDLLDVKAFDGIVSPESLTIPWSPEALHEVIAETKKNISENWYMIYIHQRAANLLRLVGYLKAWPCRHLIRDGDRGELVRLAKNARRTIAGIPFLREIHAEADWLASFAARPAAA